MWNKLFFFSIGIMILLNIKVYAADDILLITEEWPPYNYQVDGKVVGLSAEIVTHILQIINKRYEITLLPSMRTTATLDTRQNTMMFSMFRTEARETKYKWIGPLCDATIYFYKRKDSSVRIDSLEDMKSSDLDVCCRNAGLIHDLLINNGFTNLDATATSSKSIYLKLLTGRCDLAISDADLGARYTLKQLHVDFDSVFEKIPIPIFQAQLYIAASKDIADDEIKLWQDTLDTLKIRGTYDEILKKYK